MESSMLRVTIRSELKSALEQLEGKSKPGRTCPGRSDLGSDELRGAAQRDDRQMPSPAEECHHELGRPRSRCCSVYRSLR